MNVLILSESFHPKNKIGLEKILEYLKWNYKYGTINDILNFDIIYSPFIPIDTSKYPDKKFIFGPHFSVFPTHKIMDINNIHKNSVYIQPSKWANIVWKHMGAETIIPIKTFPFPVDMDKFTYTNQLKHKVFIYFKSRHTDELLFIETFLKSRNIHYKVFDYMKKYSESEYLSYLQESKYGIILGRHESQGFAIEEAMSCNVPLLVWDSVYMSQEQGYNYPNIPCTSIPYWDSRCGETFYKKEDLEKTFDIFITKLYQPREYIMEQLSLEKCSKNLVSLLSNQPFCF